MASPLTTWTLIEAAGVVVLAGVVMYLIYPFGGWFTFAVLFVAVALWGAFRAHSEVGV